MSLVLDSKFSDIRRIIDDLHGTADKEQPNLVLSPFEADTARLVILNELKNRGIKDILIISVDNLSGISDITASFPQTQIQKCIVHQIKNSTMYVSYKDLKKFVADLKPVYQAATKEEGLGMLDHSEDKWGSKYSLAIKSWRDNWAEIATFFKYPPEIRKIIYTTNIIESYHRQLRKVTKGKSVFPTDEALLKML